MPSNYTLSECLRFFDGVLATLRAGFAAMEGCVPKPSVRIRSSNVEVRYQNPSLELALFLKLARAISLLGGLRLMVEHGLIQEQGILQRAIDETDADIFFLGFGHQNGVEPLHEQFLAAFWAEEFQHVDAPLSYQRRPSVSRKKIEAYNNRVLGISDPSTAHSVDRLIQGMYSGYVHGASTHILDLFDLQGRRFSLAGLGDTPVRRSYIEDSTNYPYRVLMCAVIVARRFGLTEIADGFYARVKEAEKFIGLLSPEEADQLMAKLRKQKHPKS